MEVGWRQEPFSRRRKAERHSPCIDSGKPGIDGEVSVTYPFGYSQPRIFFARDGKPAVLWLKGGTYRVKNTIRLDRRDSNLVIAAMPGECPVLDAGLVLAPGRVRKGRDFRGDYKLAFERMPN